MKVFGNSFPTANRTMTVTSVDSGVSSDPNAQALNIIVARPEKIDCPWLYQHGSYSQTVTHLTNILGFEPSQIGTFCETIGEIASLYNHEISMEYPRDAIVKVTHSTVLSPRILGIICGNSTFSSHGDCLCVVDDGDYTLGDLLVPSSTGLCRKASDEESVWSALHQIILPKITAILAGKEFVACFLS
jgi:hypothetical protein